MARVRPVTVAVAAATLVAVGAGAYAWTRRSKKAPSRTVSSPSPSAPPQPEPTSQPRSDEPQDGYASRWQETRQDAIAICRSDEDVDSFAQAVTCALNTAYPEAAPWTSPGIWSPWMQEAFEMVRDDLLSQASRDGASPRAWEVMLWLRGDRELAACNMASPRRAARCAAMRMYPTLDWDPPLQAWQRDLVGELSKVTRRAP